MAFTKGPWIVDPENDHSVVTGDNEWQVAETYSDDDCPGDGLSDARLIAASPDLLEGCKRSVIKLSAYIGVCKDDKEIQKIVNLLDSAIAKAEG